MVRKRKISETRRRGIVEVLSIFNEQDRTLFPSKESKYWKGATGFLLMAAVLVLGTFAAGVRAIDLHSTEYAPIFRGPLPNGVKTIVSWCGIMSHSLVFFKERSLVLLAEAQTSDRLMTEVDVDRPIDAASFSCTDDGAYGFFLTKRGIETALDEINMHTHVVTQLVSLPGKGLAVPGAHLVSPNGRFVVGYPGFPLAIRRPDGQLLQVVVGPFDENRRTQPQSIEWSGDSEEAFLLFGTKHSVSIFDMRKLQFSQIGVPCPYGSKVHPDSMNHDRAWILALNSTETSYEIYRLEGLMHGRYPTCKRVLEGVQSELLHVAEDGRLVFGHSIFDRSGRAADDIARFPVATEVDTWDGSIVASLTQLPPTLASIEPAVSSDGNSIAIVEIVNAPNPGEIGEERELLLLHAKPGH